MADGPNHELNFANGILNPHDNLLLIRTNLRTNKRSEGEDGSDAYQTFLKVYLPKLAHPAYKDVFEEFIGDCQDKDAKKILVHQIAEEVKPVEEAPKKEGKKAAKK